MTDRNDRGGRGDEVSDRLSQRFENDERSEQGLNTENDERSERSQSVQNVKKEWNGTYLYLPDKLDEPLSNEYDRLVYECGRDLDWKPKKNRHYYPVVIAVGIEAIEEMDAEAFHELVADRELL